MAPGGGGGSTESEGVWRAANYLAQARLGSGRGTFGGRGGGGRRYFATLGRGRKYEAYCFFFGKKKVKVW